MATPAILQDNKQASLMYYLFKEGDLWYWQLVKADSRIIARSAEGYAVISACFEDIGLVKLSSNAPEFQSPLLSYVGHAKPDSVSQRLADGIRIALGVA